MRIGNLSHVTANQIPPSGCIIIAQALGILASETDDVRPDNSFVVGNFRSKSIEIDLIIGLRKQTV